MARTVVFVLACLLVGAVMTVGVAMACDFLDERLGRSVVFGSDHPRTQSWPVRVPGYWPAVPDRHWVEGSRFRHEHIAHHGEMWRDRDVSPMEGNQFTVIAVTSGWPMRALSKQYWHERTDGAYRRWITGGLRLPEWTWRWQGRNAYGTPIVSRPLWGGFAVNTLFFGFLAWVFVATSGQMWRWRRRRRGLCVKCGYDVSGLARCPECGAATEDASALADRGASASAGAGEVGRDGVARAVKEADV